MRNLIYVIGVANYRNLISHGRFLLRNPDLLAMNTGKWVSNWPFKILCAQIMTTDWNFCQITSINKTKQTHSRGQNKLVFTAELFLKLNKVWDIWWPQVEPRLWFLIWKPCWCGIYTFACRHFPIALISRVVKYTGSTFKNVEPVKKSF